MKTNVGRKESLWRLVGAAVAFYFLYHVDDAIGALLTFLAIGLFLVATAIWRKCPIYFALGLNSRKRKRSPRTR